ncbi:MAG: FAD/NAD(P)-binding protein, partial [Sphingomonas sp.]
MPDSITIVGMGACGVAAFAELTIRLAASPIEGVTINLVERDAVLGRGLAFGTDQPGQLLNTESRLMGLYAHEAGDFRDWLSERRAAEGRPIDPAGVEYPPRCEYGVYLRHVLDAAHERARDAGVAVVAHRAEALAVEGG